MLFVNIAGRYRNASVVSIQIKEKGKMALAHRFWQRFNDNAFGFFRVTRIVAKTEDFFFGFARPLRAMSIGNLAVEDDTTIFFSLNTARPKMYVGPVVLSGTKDAKLYLDRSPKAQAQHARSSATTTRTRRPLIFGAVERDTVRDGRFVLSAWICGRNVAKLHEALTMLQYGVPGHLMDHPHRLREKLALDGEDNRDDLFALVRCVAMRDVACFVRHEQTPLSLSAYSALPFLSLLAVFVHDRSLVDRYINFLQRSNKEEDEWRKFHLFLIKHGLPSMYLGDK